MPLHNSWENHFYSLNIGPVPFVFINIDLYFESYHVEIQNLIDQIQSDLEIANTKENR